MGQNFIHETLASGLARFDVDRLFGLVGDGNLFLVNSFVALDQGCYIGCTHEANAVLAAIGYAQFTGRTGVATITHGPALTNVTTALAEGVKGGIPLVVLCGDTAPGDLQHLQKIDQREIVRATGAGYIDMGSPDTAIEDLGRAFRLAVHERRPIVFNMRIDFQWLQVDEQSSLPPPDIGGARAGAADLEEAVAMLASARRPLVLAGRGAIGEKAREAVLRLARRVEAPVATTLKAQGLFWGEPFGLGICGTLSHPAAAEIIVRSDCIVAFGASLSRHTTDDEALTRGKRVVQILGDALETPRLGRPDLRLVGDIAATADAMVELLDMAEIPGSRTTDADMRERLQEQKRKASELSPSRPTAAATVDLPHALQQIDRALPDRRVLVADLGRFVTTVWHHLPVRRPADLVYTSHFGAIGCAMGEAIGVASVAECPTVLIAGDGGFLLSGIAELATAKREALNLAVIICNDGSYGAEHVQFTNRGMDPTLSMISPPDFAAVAGAMEIRSICVSGGASLDEACRALRQFEGPIVIDLRLDPTCIEM